MALDLEAGDFAVGAPAEVLAQAALLRERVAGEPFDGTPGLGPDVEIAGDAADVAGGRDQAEQRHGRPPFSSPGDTVMNRMAVSFRVT